MGKKQKNANVSRRDFIKKSAAVGVGATALAGLSTKEVAAAQRTWDYTADVVIVGGGCSGISAAIRARDLGASVLVVEENYACGGHAMISGGQIRLGGGTRIQIKQGIEDSADLIFLENTRPEHPYTRYHNRGMVRAFADHNLEVFNWIEANGIKFDDTVPLSNGGSGVITNRLQTAIRPSDDFNQTINNTNGSGVMLPLIASATAKGAQYLLKHRMTSFIREGQLSGRVLGVVATDLTTNKTVNIQARKAVIGATGGSSSNVNIRTIYNPNNTEEYQVGCEPWSRQSGDTEEQGMAIGAALGGTACQTNEAGIQLQKLAWLANRYGYTSFNPQSPLLDKAGSTGFAVNNYQNGIFVNMLGQRFYSEVDLPPTAEEGAPSGRYNFFARAFGSVIVGEEGKKQRLGGPVWFIFDDDARARLNMSPTHPTVDIANGYFFTADTLAELAAKVIGNQYQKFAMSGANLQATVDRYNGFVDAGEDPDFNKPLKNSQGALIGFKVQKPPFYAAWATPINHDTMAGLRVNGKWQVIDIHGQVIPSFYCTGEGTGGFTQHGLARCIVGGYIAAENAVLEPSV
jgi:succinate dehydrogenase/fumarate reductase flavoprotein subunit